MIVIAMYVVSCFGDRCYNITSDQKVVLKMEHRLLNVTTKSTSEVPFNLMIWLLLSEYYYCMSKGKRMYVKNLVFYNSEVKLAFITVWLEIFARENDFTKS